MICPAGSLSKLMVVRAKARALKLSATAKKTKKLPGLPIHGE